MIKCQELVHYLNTRLLVDATEDASRNGLQVQGAKNIKRIGLATDAAIDVYKKARDLGCQMLIAHHGLIWKGLYSVTGRNYDHIKFLLENDMNLYAAHLPLDKHPEIGNNAELGRVIELENRTDFGHYHGVSIGFSGTLKFPLSLDQLAARFQKVVGGSPVTLSFGKKQIASLGIVSGGGSSTLGEAIELDLDCLVTGEGQHENYHLAKEGGINVLYLGHYHSETLGVRALGKELEAKFDLETVFIDEPTIF